MQLAIRILPLLALLVPGTLLCRADTPPRQTPAATLAALKQEQKQAYDKQFAAYEKATTDDQRKKEWEAYRPKRDAVVARAVALARDNPKDPAAREALTWVITGGLGWNDDTEKAFDLLVRDHLRSDKLDTVCGIAGIDWQQKAAERFLRAVLEKSPHRTMRGIACVSLARNLRYQAQAAQYQKRPDADRLAKESEKAYERVAAEFADVQFRDRKLGDRARAALFEMRNLLVGKEVPDVAGEDVDGKKFKLSDYRGKVVLLDFWGHW
jgi:hypothetical protein